MQYRVDRPSLGAVVKPIWLLTTMWIVPPVRYPGQLREVQGLGHQPLPCERRIAVDQDRDAEPAVPVLEPALLGPHSPFDDRVDCLQVAGVGREREMDRVLVGRDVVGREAEVILDVAVTADGLGQVVAFELVEDHSVRFIEDVGQHVEPAPVRHAHDNFADSGALPLAR